MGTIFGELELGKVLSGLISFDVSTFEFRANNSPSLGLARGSKSMGPGETPCRISPEAETFNTIRNIRSHSTERLFDRHRLSSARNVKIRRPCVHALHTPLASSTLCSYA